MSTGQFTFQSGAYTTTSSVRTVTALYYSVFSLFRRVSCTFMNYITYFNSIVHSWQGTPKWCWFPQIPASAITLFFSENFSRSQALYDQAWGCPLHRWTLQESYLWVRTIYCWLPGAVSPRLYCSGLVRKVVKLICQRWKYVLTIHIF